MKIKFFPWGVAEGDAFFDREKEIAQLNDNLQHGRHTLLLSPRRYGKTSLAKYILNSHKPPHAEIDLFLVFDEGSIEFKFIKGAQNIIQKVSDTPEQWFNTLRHYFAKAEKKWTIGIKGLSLEMTPEKNHYIPDNILDALNAVEYILSKKKQQAILFVDEFQEINKLKIGTAIEGAIRNFAQSSNYLTFIFSGSNRHLLMNMFSNSERPLYKLCDRINLDLIAKDYYEKYLQNIAKKTWHDQLKTDIFEAIMNLTERHPHCVYVLCSYIWRSFPNHQPNSSQITKCWEEYINDMLKETRADLDKLSMGQLKILILIALDSREITGKESQRKLNLTGSAISQALKVLMELDYIQKTNNHNYRIINPLIKHTLTMFYKEYLYSI